MPAEVIVALIGASAVLCTGGGAWLGHILASRTAARAHKTTAEHQMIDQLQEELSRYRERTDKRLDALESENRAYRSFIGVQRDHMAEHGIPLPPWPEGLPR